MADGSVLLDVQNVGLTLGGNLILKDLSFRILDRVRPGVVTGQIAALLGPSGVGKTRLLRILAGLDAPDEGSVCGPEGAPLVAGSVGVVFQNYPLLRHRTVEQNLVLAGQALGRSAAESKDRAEHLLKEFGLTNRAQVYPAQLSGGQRQRVAIAQQLMKDRPLLLLDEPFSGLDPAALVNVVKLLIEVAHMHEANSLIIVTHDIRAALLASDMVFMLGRTGGPQGKGAQIMHTFDMVERGLAWREDVEQDPKFVALEQEIKGLFRHL